VAVILLDAAVTAVDIEADVPPLNPAPTSTPTPPLYQQPITRRIFINDWRKDRRRGKPKRPLRRSTGLDVHQDKMFFQYLMMQFMGCQRTIFLNIWIGSANIFF